MSALTIILVRHAEKPGREFPGPGLTADGTQSEESLVVRGCSGRAPGRRCSAPASAAATIRGPA